MITFKGIEMSPDFTARSQKAIRNAQDALDQKCIALMEDYTPISMKGGITKASHHKWVYFKGRGKMSKAHKQEKPGLIINTEPTARLEYFVNKGFSGGKRGKYWLDRMKADHGHELLKTAKEHCK